MTDVEKYKFIIKKSIIAYSPEIILSYIIAMLCDFNFKEGFYVYLGIHFIYFLIWMKTSIVRYLISTLGGKKLIINAYKRILKENDFPKNLDWEDEMIYYLEDVISGNYKEKTKIEAAKLIGQIQMLVEIQEHQMSYRLRTAFERALLEYNRDK